MRRCARDAISIYRSELFHESFYLSQSFNLAGKSAIAHFVEFGNDEELWPNPLFDPVWYLKRYPDVKTKRRNALAHYIEFGESEGRWPNPLFDPGWYLAHYPDVGADGQQALTHYFKFGELEGRLANGCFDPAWYAEQYALPSRSGALSHYLRVGRYGGVAPTASFDPQTYLRSLSDCRLGPEDAFLHYVSTLSREDLAGLSRRRPCAASPEEPVEACVADIPAPDSPAESYRYVAPLQPTNLADRIARLGRRPFFSVVTPVFNVAPRYLDAAIGSVREQWYPDWELVLVDDASTEPATRAFLDRVNDPRITLRRQASNGGIAAATNAALALARGDYVVFLDHDDVLTPDCLYELARAIAETDADYLYSDEDKIDGEDASFSPFFKPSWSPDALMSIMYTCHVSCARRSLIAACGGLRPDFDGAQDYDLVLRLTERAKRIAHVPKVLYHWRSLPSSLAASGEAKPYAHDAVRRLKEEALLRRGLTGTVEPVAAMPGQYRVNYHPRPGTFASLVILTRNNGQLVEALVDSIRAKTTYPHFEIVVVDNGSTDPATIATLARLAGEDLRVRVDSQPFNYSALNNTGAAATRGDVLVFLNDDMEIVSADWLERLVGYAQLPHVGAVGARLLYPDGRIQHCGVVNLAHGPGHALYRAEPGPSRYYGRDSLEYDWIAVTGACLAIERTKFDALGGFDESLPIAYNDVELCFRLVEAGFYNVVCQSVELIHHESLTRGADDNPRRLARLRREFRQLYRRHPRFLGHDPFFSPNLHPNDVRFTPNPH